LQWQQFAKYQKEPTNKKSSIGDILSFFEKQYCIVKVQYGIMIKV